MKNRVLMIVLIAFLFSCSNIFNSESHIVLSFANSSRSLDDLGNATKVELWISETFVDYELVENPVNLRYLDDIDSLSVDSLSVDPLSVDQVLDSSEVRYIKFDGDTLDFDITTGITRNFTVRVEYSSGRVFYGTKESTIEPFTTTIPIQIKETPTSKQEQWFSDLDDSLNEKW